MGQHKLGYFLTQGRELPHFVSSTMEAHSFTCPKLQSAFPTVWLIFQQRDLYTALAYYSQCKNLLKMVFCINFWHGQNFFLHFVSSILSYI